VGRGVRAERGVGRWGWLGNGRGGWVALLGGRRVGLGWGGAGGRGGGGGRRMGGGGGGGISVWR